MTTMDANALRDTIFIDPATGAGTKAPEVRAVAQHHSAIERAVADYERQAAALAPGGRPIYTDHAERLAALQVETDQAFIVAEEELGALFRQAVADEEAASATNPMDRLDEAEITRANSRRAFVNEDAERLPLDELVQRVQRSGSSGCAPPISASRPPRTAGGSLRLTGTRRAPSVMRCVSWLSGSLMRRRSRRRRRGRRWSPKAATRSTGTSTASSARWSGCAAPAATGGSDAAARRHHQQHRRSRSWRALRPLPRPPAGANHSRTGLRSRRGRLRPGPRGL